MARENVMTRGNELRCAGEVRRRPVATARMAARDVLQDPREIP